jgi:hypothetical protein
MILALDALHFIVERIHFGTIRAMFILSSEQSIDYRRHLSPKVIADRLCGLVVRVPGYRAEMYCVSCEVRTEFIYVM